MKILIVTDKMNINTDPNINLVKNITDLIAHEHNVCFLGHSTKKDEESEFCFVYDLDEKVRELYFSLNKVSIAKKIVRLLSHPVLSFFAIFKIFNIDLIALKYAKLIRKLDKKYKFDAIISVSSPFYTTKGLAKVKTSAKKIIMMFDPYADHYIYKNKRTRKQQEKCFKQVDYIFMPTLLKKQYLCNKIIGFEFPALIFKENNEKKLYEKDKINLAFVGSLYSDIRNPSFLYDLLMKLEIENIKLTVIGGIYGEFSNEFNNKYNQIIQKKVNIVGKVDKKIADSYMQQADILVNIGNTVDNMLPSKIIEYISTGKPIINISQIENYPEKEYIDLYKNAINIFSKCEVDDKILEDIKTFILNCKVVNNKEILKNFKNCTPEFVLEQVLNKIKE